VGQLFAADPGAVLSAALLAFMWLRRGRVVGLFFYGLFALAITASVSWSASTWCSPA
jgi:hypothetical protein